MSKALSAMWLAALVAIGANGAEVKPVAYFDLTSNFSRFVDETAGMEEAARVVQFRTQMDELLPGFYTPRDGATPEHYDARIARALQEFPDLRPRYERTEREFPAAFEAGIQHFRKAFPGLTLHIPVYLLHSLGEMDGGIRVLGGKNYMIFGADVIALLHDSHTLTPFLDHELFHVEHVQYFPECGQVWCALWIEGLATYAAKVMNPGADDGQLLLTAPKPIRAAVDATWPSAACFARSKLYSSADEDINALLSGGPEGGEFPRRFGYYVGLRVAEELGGKYSLEELAQMPPIRVQTELSMAFGRLIQKAGGCPSGRSRPTA